MIEVSGGPATRRFSVTRLAIGGKTGVLVVRAGRSVVIIPVAAHTVRWRPGKPIVSMAIGAICPLVLSPKGEAPIVIEDSARPARRGCAVAARAIGWKSRLLVIGVRRPLIVGPVAAHAIGRDAREAAFTVALSAIRRPVTSSQTKGGMIERSTLPAHRARVADLALHRETRCDVVGVLSSLEFLRMATRTFRDRTAEPTGAMALHAVERSMRALEPEPGNRFVFPSSRLEPAPDL